MGIRGRVKRRAKVESAGVYVLVSRGTKVHTLTIGGFKKSVREEARKKREGGSGGKGGGGRRRRRRGGEREERGCSKEQTRETGKPLPVWLSVKKRVGMEIMSE